MNFQSMAFRVIALGTLLTISIVSGQQLSTSAKLDGSSKATPVAKPDPAAAPTPRMADGRPDLSGIWYHREPGPPIELKSDGSAIYELGTQDGLPAVKKDPDAKIAYPSGRPAAPKNLPEYKPEYLPKVEELRANLAKTDPAWSGAPPGLPRVGVPHQIIQGKDDIAFLYADLNGSFYRTVAIDGRPKSAVHRLDRSYFGDSYGHWEGDTLTVDVDNFNDDTWLGDNALIHSKNLHVTERFTRKGNTLLYEATVTDPIMLTQPWEVPSRTLTLSEEPVYEAPPCIESDQEHIIGNEGTHENVR